MESTIATHPQRAKIIDAILAKQPYRDICAWTVPPVSSGAIGRFKRHGLEAIRRNAAQGRSRRSESIYKDVEVMTSEDKAVASAALQVAVSPFRQQLSQLRDVTMESIERARTAVRVDKDGNVTGQDLACIAPLLAQGHRNVELLGKATGELDDRPAVTNNLMISLNMPRGD